MRVPDFLSGSSASPRALGHSETIYFYLKPIGFRKSIDGLVALAELETAAFNLAFFVFLNGSRAERKVLISKSRIRCYFSTGSTVDGVRR